MKRWGEGRSRTFSLAGLTSHLEEVLDRCRAVPNSFGGLEAGDWIRGREEQGEFEFGVGTRLEVFLEAGRASLAVEVLATKLVLSRSNIPR